MAGVVVEERWNEQYFDEALVRLVARFDQQPVLHGDVDVGNQGTVWEPQLDELFVAQNAGLIQSKRNFVGSWHVADDFDRPSGFESFLRIGTPHCPPSHADADLTRKLTDVCFKVLFI